MNPIKILPLGMSGSGKSVYLAALYDKLAIKKPDTCFSMQTSVQIGMELAQTYNGVKNPTKPWPPGTMGAGYNEYAFDCIVRGTGGEQFCLMKLLYLDFPGGLLKGDSQDERFFKRFEESNAFLVLLDGVQILRALKGEAAAKDELYDDLEMILKPLQAGLGKPLHFVVTKWDVLESKFRLDAVADLLKGLPVFKAIIELRERQGSGTRLIPVSAVGSNFAELQPDGRMKKVENAKAEPFNVDLPISCLLFDLLSEAKIKWKGESKRHFLARLRYQILGASEALVWLGRTAADFLPIPSALNIVKALVNMGADKIEHVSEEKRKEMRASIGASILETSSAEAAFSQLVEYQKMETHWMVRQYPASLLSAYKE